MTDLTVLLCMHAVLGIDLPGPKCISQGAGASSIVQWQAPEINSTEIKEIPL